MSTYSVNIIRENGGELRLESDFTQPIQLPDPGSELIITIFSVPKLVCLNTFTSVFSGELNSRKLKIEYSLALSHEPNNYTDWIEIPTNGDSPFVEVSPFYDYDIRLRFSRTGSNTTENIVVDSFVWVGEWDENDTELPLIDLTPGISPVIFKAPDIYKVFRLDGYELVAKNITDLETSYRISQNDGRTWTEWTPLTDDNISTEKIDPIRFFQIEYMFTHTGTSGTIQIRDLNLHGEFINVSQNYTTGNLLGLRENCKNGLIGNTGLNGATGSNNLSITNLTSDGEVSVWKTMECDPASLFNPYNLGSAIDLYNKLSNDVSNLFGWKVEYFKTEPDLNAIDHSIHEYSLYGVTDFGEVKIIVPDNQFPSNQVAFNQFDLALLESFEVHITKEEFKNVFGVHKRPNREDYMFFCDIGQMYMVDHAQAIRDFGNAAVYYKLIMSKYSQKASVKPVNSTIQDKVNDIVKNSTLEELFGTQKKDDKKEVAFKKQHDTLSKDRIRNEIVASVEKELLDNAELVLSKYHYNLSVVTPGNVAVTYQTPDTYLNMGHNRSFMAWFKLLDYADSDTYNLISNYNSDENLGYKVDIQNGLLTTTMNTATYSMDVSTFMDDDIWYCYLINVDQRQKTIDHYLYKRNVDREIDAKNLHSTELRLLTNNTETYSPVEFEFEPDDVTLQINASFMRLTNIRIYDDVIPVDQHTKILNQQIVRDTDHIILADNANKQFTNLSNFPYK